jgi:ferric-dicitrate binding protein FerR (iron transport regulator)
MKSNVEHINKNLKRNDEPIDRFSNGTIPWNLSREEVWKEMESRIGKEPVSGVLKIRSAWIRFSAAAVILILLGISFFIRYYTRYYTTETGQQLEIVLPDGSKASLNASTSVTYHPYWWRFTRKIELKGEAFFTVEKGKEFEVISALGHTIVVGTSFNILSVDDVYEVTCMTGKVRVIAKATGDEAILTQNQKALLGSSGRFNIDYEANALESTAWTRGEFYFTSAPLTEVFRKIELRYGITIEYKQKDTLFYTGYFKKDKKVENILNLVCLPFGMKFEETSDRVYQIILNE